MERKEIQPGFVWNKNRATTMLLLGVSILLIVYAINLFAKLIYLNNESKKLQQTLEQLIIENEKEVQGENVINTGNMTITVYDNYVTDVENVYTFPK